MNAKETAPQEAIAKLREWLKPGDTVYTILRHVSRSGMSRDISVVLIKPGEDEPYFLHPNHATATALGWRLTPSGVGYDAVKVSGGGMDMGFHLVETLSYALYGRGDALRQRWL